MYIQIHPAQREFKVVLRDCNNVTLQLMNNCGNVVFNKKARRTETNISSTNLSKGTYILSCDKGRAGRKPYIASELID